MESDYRSQLRLLKAKPDATATCNLRNLNVETAEDHADVGEVNPFARRGGLPRTPPSAGTGTSTARSGRHGGLEFGGAYSANSHESFGSSPSPSPFPPKPAGFGNSGAAHFEPHEVEHPPPSMPPTSTQPLPPYGRVPSAPSSAGSQYRQVVRSAAFDLNEFPSRGGSPAEVVHDGTMTANRICSSHSNRSNNSNNNNNNNNSNSHNPVRSGRPPALAIQRQQQTHRSIQIAGSLALRGGSSPATSRCSETSHFNPLSPDSSRTTYGSPSREDRLSFGTTSPSSPPLSRRSHSNQVPPSGGVGTPSLSRGPSGSLGDGIAATSSSATPSGLGQPPVLGQTGRTSSRGEPPFAGNATTASSMSATRKRGDEGVQYFRQEELPEFPQQPTERWLGDVLKRLANAEDWSVQFDAIDDIRRLAKHAPKILFPSLRKAVSQILELSDSLRSGLAKNALRCLGELFARYGRRMDVDVDASMATILKRASDTNHFISDEAELSLAEVFRSASQNRLIPSVLLSMNHRQVRTRQRATWCLVMLWQRLLQQGNTKDVKALMDATSKALSDANPHVRSLAKVAASLLHGSNLAPLPVRLQEAADLTVSELDAFDLSSLQRVLGQPPFGN